MTILQVTVLFLVFTLVYTRSRRSGPIASQSLPSPASFRIFTPSDLLDFNGTNGKGIYIAVRGRVFDVSTSKNFYGPVRYTIRFSPSFCWQSITRCS